jgi:hypothetical protein
MNDVPNLTMFRADNRSRYDGMSLHLQGNVTGRVNVVVNYTLSRAKTWGCVLGELFDYVEGVCNPLHAFGPGDFGSLRRRRYPPAVGGRNIPRAGRLCGLATRTDGKRPAHHADHSGGRRRHRRSSRRSRCGERSANRFFGPGTTVGIPFVTQSAGWPAVIPARLAARPLGVALGFSAPMRSSLPVASCSVQGSGRNSCGCAQKRGSQCTIQGYTTKLARATGSRNKKTSACGRNWNRRRRIHLRSNRLGQIVYAGDSTAALPAVGRKRRRAPYPPVHSREA